MLLNDYLINDKQYKIFIELFAHEDFNILSAYEVFCYTDDVNDFVDTLFTIEMYEQQVKRLEIVDDTEDNKEQKEKQFNILYKWKESLPPTCFREMAVAIQQGNTGILLLDNMRKSGEFNSETFLKNLVAWGKMLVQKKAEKDLSPKNKNGSPKNIDFTSDAVNVES